MTQETAVLVVNRYGRAGKCSNCNKPAGITDVTHKCGATFTQLAIEASGGVTFAHATMVAASRSNLEFVGTGRIVRAPSGRLWFQVLRRPGDLP